MHLAVCAGTYALILMNDLYNITFRQNWLRHWNFHFKMITGNTLYGYAPQYKFKNDANFWQIFQSLLSIKYCNCYKCVTIIFMYFSFIVVVKKFNTNRTILCIILYRKNHSREKCIRFLKSKLYCCYITAQASELHVTLHKQLLPTQMWKTFTSSNKCVNTKLDICC